MKRIYIFDDDEKIRFVFEQYLKGHGYDVVCAKDGKEGLRLLDREAPDLVVTDIMMPDIDGLEVVLSMRKEHPCIPVIAVSGGIACPVTEKVLPAMNKTGNIKVLYKPVKLEDLLDKIHELLGEKKHMTYNP